MGKICYTKEYSYHIMSRSPRHIFKVIIVADAIGTFAQQSQSSNLIHKEGGIKNHDYVVKNIKSVLPTYKIPKITGLPYFIPK
jgi:hypothetical protein